MVSPLVLAKWSPWGRWGTCSVTCGGGRRIRRRTCVRTSGTAQCTGRPVEVQKCGKAPCPRMRKHTALWTGVVMRSDILASMSPHSQMSAGMPWGTPQWGLQPVPVWRSYFIRRNPQHDGRARGRSLGGASQSAQGGPRPYGCQRSVQAHWCLLLQFHVDLHQEGEVCSGYSRQCQQHHWDILGACCPQISR